MQVSGCNPPLSPPGLQELGPPTPMVASLSPPTDTRLSARPATGDPRPGPWRLCPVRPHAAGHMDPAPRPCPGRPTPARALCWDLQGCPSGPPPPARAVPATVGHPSLLRGRRQGGEGRRPEGLQQRLNGIFVYFWEARVPVWGNTFGPHKAGGREQTTPAPAGLAGRRTGAATARGARAGREVTAPNSRVPPQLRKAAAQAIKAKALRKKC